MVCLTAFLLMTVCAVRAADLTRLDFAPLSFPEDPADWWTVRVAHAVTVTPPGGSGVTYHLSYQPLYHGGDVDRNGNVAMQILTRSGKPMRVSTKPDGNSLLFHGDRPVLISHMEDRPSVIYAAHLSANPDGTFMPAATWPLDASAVGGLYHTCASDSTPWNTHLTAEEDYDMEGFFFDPATKNLTSRHLAWCTRNAAGRLDGGYKAPAFDSGRDDSGWCKSMAELINGYLEGDEAFFSPYLYGYIVEVGLDGEGKPEIRHGKKLLTFGKATPEIAIVMPDQRTVYTSDDGGHRTITMFIADRPGDLTAGTLYLMKWNQTSAAGGGAADIAWVKLAHATVDDIDALLQRRPLFTDLFDARVVEGCPVAEGFRVIAAGDPSRTCLRLRDGTGGSTLAEKFKTAGEQHLAAAIFEKRKYGAWLGATTEWSSLEAMTYDPDHNRIWLASSGIGGEMKKEDHAPADHMQVIGTDCGAVYAMELGKDGELGSDYVVSNMFSVLSGHRLLAGQPGADRNVCDPENIASPDNIRYLKGTGTVLIGEDTGDHVVNQVWAYDHDRKRLSRVMTMPTGAESAGSFFPYSAADRSWIFINVQHPFQDGSHSITGGSANRSLFDAATSANRRGVVGYLHGLPNLGW